MNLLILTEIFLSLVAASVSTPSPTEKMENSGVEPLDSDQIFLQVVNVPWNLVDTDDSQWSLTKRNNSRQLKAQRIREKKTRSRNRRLGASSVHTASRRRNPGNSYPSHKTVSRKGSVVKKKRPAAQRQKKGRRKSSADNSAKYAESQRPSLDFGRDSFDTRSGIEYQNRFKDGRVKRSDEKYPPQIASPTKISPDEEFPNEVSPDDSGPEEPKEHEVDESEVEHMDFHGEELMKKVGKGIKKIFRKIKEKKEAREKDDEEGKEVEDDEKEEEEEEEDEESSYHDDYEVDDCDDDIEETEEYEEYETESESESESDDCDDSETASETDDDSDSDSDCDSDDDCDNTVDGYKAIRIESPGSKPKIIRMKNNLKLDTFDPTESHISVPPKKSSTSKSSQPTSSANPSHSVHSISSKYRSAHPPKATKSLNDKKLNRNLTDEKLKQQKLVQQEFQPRTGDIYLPEDENEHSSSGFKYSYPIGLLLGGPIIAVLIM
ncbi:BA75_04122T0 [Komagataella pastoris]|uniref:BA75_04122T0 n=1 Tax=Komagataella pastoris TaxID=4922 RepID=A0A1B2JFM7_PICPA|nr:BA75_04122T0 [Komagataella pastoris]